MRTRSLQLLIATAAAALALPALSASAEDASVNVELTVEGQTAEGLSIDVATGSVAIDGDAGDRVDRALPQTTIESTSRGTWQVRVVGENFVNTSDAGVMIEASNAAVYMPYADAGDLLTNLGTLGLLMNPLGGTFGPQGGLLGDNHTLAEPYTLVHGDASLGILGLARMSYTPRIEINVPSDQLSGTYSGTVTQTISAVTD